MPKKIEETTAIPVETNEVAEVKKEPAPVKKTRKPREKVRTTAELVDVPVKKMTEKEKEQMIEFYKEQNRMLEQKLDALDVNITSAYEKLRNSEDQYNAMESYFKRQLQYINTQVEAFHTAVNHATRGGNL